VHVIPEELDNAIAVAKLRSLGISLTQTRANQKEDVKEMMDGGHHDE
jgi:S-adenosylhomocysteine hydrolase